jgi:hypothetical protein
VDSIQEGQARLTTPSQNANDCKNVKMTPKSGLLSYQGLETNFPIVIDNFYIITEQKCSNSAKGLINNNHPVMSLPYIIYL